MSASVDIPEAVKYLSPKQGNASEKPPPLPYYQPFKRRPAKIGYERIQEIENPELDAERARQYYRELGYSEAWIAKRLQSIEIRGRLRSLRL